MNKNAKIFIAGANGMVGSALTRNLRQYGYSNLLTPNRNELDLTNQAAVQAYFAQYKPEFVFLAAAKVGGILANNTYPADFININLAIQQNVIVEALKNNITRLLFLGSSCIYPRDCPQPIKETYLLTGPLESTNRPYAIAKIAGIEQCFACNRQYRTKFLAVMPTNLYGPNDNYDLSNSHVLPALLRKFHDAKINKQNEVVIWGTGAPKREFLYVDDLAEACVFLLNLPDQQFTNLIANDSLPPLINIGCGEDISICDLAELIKEIVGFSGVLKWDQTKPDGTLRKLLDISQITNLGWKPKLTLREGIKLTYENFKKEKASNG